jgi:hypothetical protein
LYVYYDCGTPEIVSNGYHAIGTGRQYAIGAMCHGATPRQAIIIASTFDPFSKKPVQTLRLK